MVLRLVGGSTLRDIHDEGRLSCEWAGKRYLFEADSGEVRPDARFDNSLKVLCRLNSFSSTNNEAVNYRGNAWAFFLVLRHAN